jgi:hypothetical protein
MAVIITIAAAIIIMVVITIEVVIAKLYLKA